MQNVNDWLAISVAYTRTPCIFSCFVNFYKKNQSDTVEDNIEESILL